MCARYLGCGNGNYEFKIRFYWYRSPGKTTDVQHPVISEEIGGSLGAVPWLALSVIASRISPSRRFLRWNLQLGIPCWELLLTGMGCLSVVFWEENLFWILFLRNTYIVICVLPLLVKQKKTLGRFQLEVPRAYKCKQILGLCHPISFMVSHPRMSS